MEQKHRSAISNNFMSLIEQTNLDQLVPLLYEKGVFSEAMIDPYRESSGQDARSRKRKLYLTITKRGPQAYKHLLDALQETGHWDLVRALEPDHALHPVNSVISLRKANIARNTAVEYEESVTNRPIPYEPDLPKNGNKPKHIKVIPSASFSESSSDILCYSIRTKNRGILLMITNIDFNGIEPYRRGAGQDQANLTELFKQIGFHKLLCYNNLSKKEMEETIQTTSKLELLPQTECMFVVIASHGYLIKDTTDTDIRCSGDGGLVSTKFIIDCFNNYNCPNLRNIPKVFLFQTCRGDKSDLGVTNYISEKPKRSLETETDGASTNYHHNMRTYSDILIANATLPGYASHRDPIQGSWYINAVCDVFAKHAHDRHIEDLFKLVDERLMEYSKTSVQTSSVENRGFNKHLYLHPGLFED